MKDDKINEELLSIITAVAMAATGKKVKVKRINFLDNQKSNQGWALVGRINVMANHNINLKGM